MPPDKIGIFGLIKQLLLDVRSRLILQVTNPIKVVVEPRNSCQVIKNRVVIATVADHQPHSPLTSVSKDGLHKFGVSRHLFNSV